jgi:peptide/nickel transport system permease protein
MGALMGYFGGWVDIVGMRIIEIFMAIPRLFLLLTVIAFIPPSLNEYMLYAMMAVIGAFSWMNSARFIRAEFMRLRDQDFVQAAQACGLPLRSILFRHMLPNGVSPVLVDASFGVAAAIFIETGLSFLGFGIRPPDPSWGQMLSKAVDPTTGIFYWWLAIFPGILIFLTVFSFNLIGDALRDAIDPKLKKSQ